jgi:hypothetical protein
MNAFAVIKCLAVAAVFGSAIGCTSSEKSPSGEAKTSDAASVWLIDLEGSPFDLLSAGQNRVRVAVFTRSDCPVSNRYAPRIRELHEEFHPRVVDFYLIYVDPKEPAEAIRAHLDEFDYPCVALRDPEHSLAAYTQATVTPEAVVFDANGKITYRGRIDNLYAELGKARPEATTHELRDAIEATLSGRLVAEPVTKAVGCYIGDLK